MLISIEIMLLSITFLILLSSLNMDDIIGQTYAIYIIVVAGAESAIGLGILVAFYRLIHSLNKNPKLNSSYSHFNLFPLSSNIIQRRNYSTALRPRTRSLGLGREDRKITLNPLFVTGFSDAESSFVVTILKNPRYKIG